MPRKKKTPKQIQKEIDDLDAEWKQYHEKTYPKVYEEFRQYKMNMDYWEWYEQNKTLQKEYFKKRDSYYRKIAYREKKLRDMGIAPRQEIIHIDFTDITGKRLREIHSIFCYDCGDFSQIMGYCKECFAKRHPLITLVDENPAYKYVKGFQGEHFLTHVEFVALFQKCRDMDDQEFIKIVLEKLGPRLRGKQQIDLKNMLLHQKVAEYYS